MQRIMMSVHEAISKHSKEQHEVVKVFVELESRRELAIAEAVMKCKNGETFSVDVINAVTREMNLSGRKGVVPERKYVTVEMVQEYANRA